MRLRCATLAFASRCALRNELRLVLLLLRVAQLDAQAKVKATAKGKSKRHGTRTFYLCESHVNITYKTFECFLWLNEAWRDG